RPPARIEERTQPRPWRAAGEAIAGSKCFSSLSFDRNQLSWEEGRVHHTAILEVKQLGKSYPNGNGILTVLRDVNFSLPVRSTCAIVGPSGSGKTTLLSLCAGLDEPSTGEVILDGVSLGDLNEDGRARVRNELVGFVFQSFQLIPTLTALENVM